MRCECNSTLCEGYTPLDSCMFSSVSPETRWPAGQLTLTVGITAIAQQLCCAATLCACACAWDAFMHFNCALTHAQLLHKTPSRASLSVSPHLPHLLSLPPSHTQETQKSTGTNEVKRQTWRKDRKENPSPLTCSKRLFRAVKKKRAIAGVTN